MSLRERAAVAATRADSGIRLQRVWRRRGVRWEASRNGVSLGVLNVYTGGDVDGWTVDGESHETFAEFLDAAYRLGKGSIPG